ncbi:unnamed protein product [Ascophyllum nodosum]
MDYYTDVAEVPTIVAAVRETSAKGIPRELQWRREQLSQLKRMMEENEGAIAEALATDLRRPYTEAVIIEVWDVLAEVIYFEKNLEKLSRTDKLQTPLKMKPLSFEVWKEPRGVVTIIAPWNFPVSLILGPLAGALAAGNSCVLKPSEVSEAISRVLAEIIPKYFDRSCVGVVSGGVEQTTALLAEKVDCIMYTGGGHVGKIVLAAAAKNLTPVTLELGGKCPVYIDQSANLETAARRIAYFKTLNCGQVCIAPDHILVHEKVRDAFLEHLNKEHDSLYPGKEKDNPDKSRIINGRHFKRVSALLDGHGGEVVRGGNSVELERYLDFTVITDPAPDSPLMQEEIFGPILPVIKVGSVEDAISYCKCRPIPLAAYVFERDATIRKKWLSQVASGGACVNDCLYHISNKELGFGGKGESGMGATKGRASFETFTHRKVVGIQPANFDIRSKYPPLPQKLTSFMKMLFLGELPSWVKMTWRGMIGVAVAGLAYLVSQHVSVSIVSNSITLSVY